MKEDGHVCVVTGIDLASFYY